MPAPIPPLHGEELLAAVTEAMVALHERYHHRVPVSAKTQLLGDDLIAVVMGGVYTEVEKTLIELQRVMVVQETRSAFQEAMQQRFIDEVERLSGRDVEPRELWQAMDRAVPDLEDRRLFFAPVFF